MLNNPVDAGLALNRLGTLYGKQNQFKLSLQYHLKHLDMLSGPERFIAKYNVALAMRMCNKLDSARDEIQSAIRIVEERHVSQKSVSHLVFVEGSGVDKSVPGLNSDPRIPHIEPKELV